MSISKGFSTLCTFGLLSDKRLTAMDKQVYLYVKFRYQFFKSLNDSFRESISTISVLFGVSEKTVSRSLKHLVNLGYLEKKESPGKPSEYALPRKEKWVTPDMGV